MISYELALKLKEAGFPQPEKPVLGHYNSWILKNTFGVAYYKVEDQGEPTLIRLFPGMCYALESVYIPNLSELIEACKPEFESLIAPFFRASLKWEAQSAEINRDFGKEPGMGSTPEEAVANLYLALAKK